MRSSTMKRTGPSAAVVYATGASPAAGRSIVPSIIPIDLSHVKWAIKLLKVTLPTINWGDALKNIRAPQSSLRSLASPDRATRPRAVSTSALASAAQESASSPVRITSVTGQV
jgi:hypothetical protein